MLGGMGGVLALMGEWPATGKGPVIEVQRDWSRACDQAALDLGRKAQIGWASRSRFAAAAQHRCANVGDVICPS